MIFNFKAIISTGIYIHILYLIIFLNSFTNVFVKCLTQKEIDHHLEMGKKLLAAGQLADALTHYHSAIDGDPTNYQPYFRRATVYLAMGRAKSALQDLNKVIELKPDFSAARMQRANVLVKEGDFDKAKADYKLVLKNDKNNVEAMNRIDTIDRINEEIDEAKSLMNNYDYQNAIDKFTKILETCPWSIEIHKYRSECFLKIGDYQRAISDLKALSKLVPDNTDAYYRISELSYILGDAETSINNIRECLKLDPDHRKCSDFYKKLKKLLKFLENTRKSHDDNNYNECINNANKLIEIEPNSQNFKNFKNKAQSYICSCNSKGRNVKEAIATCSDLLKQIPNDADALYYRAQAYILDERNEEALADCNKAHESEDSQRIHECIQKVQKLIKQSKKRDYYKILGVKRSASKQDIVKAYRKLAHKWHPDKYTGTDKEKAQKIFIEIAAAKEVLTDPEKRSRFDNGEDPLDAEEQAQHGHGFNPFAHGFNPFGGGGGSYQFHFKFN